MHDNAGILIDLPECQETIIACIVTTYLEIKEGHRSTGPKINAVKDWAHDTNDGKNNKVGNDL